MAIVDKTFKVPYVRIHTGSTSYTAVTDVVIHSIQVTSDNGDDDATITITPLGDSAAAVKVSSGDTIYGPFTAYTITAATDSEVAIIAHERSQITTN
jgi:hypothetical protein